MPDIPEGIEASDVTDAIQKIDKGVTHGFGESTGYDLVYLGRRYPPKAVLGLAASRIVGHPLGPYDFKGGEKSKAFAILRGLGFEIERKNIAAGDDWTEDEIRLLVEDYFAMLGDEAAGRPYSKTEHRNALLRELPLRSKGSIEFKHQNVSAVLFDLGFPFIKGYKPARNYQRNTLPDIVLEHLISQEEAVAQIQDNLARVAQPNLAELDFSAARAEAPELTPAPDTIALQARRPRKLDYAARDAANRDLGRAGEEFVVAYEKWVLTQAGRADLAARVQWISKEQGDGLGYDVASFDHVDHEPMVIEVKTTNAGAELSFYVSNNELKQSKEMESRYRLYRVFNFSKAPQFYEVIGDLEVALNLTPSTYVARR